MVQDDEETEPTGKKQRRRRHSGKGDWETVQSKAGLYYRPTLSSTLVITLNNTQQMQTRNTTISITVATLNINGAWSPLQQHLLNSFIQRNNIDMLALQEVVHTYFQFLRAYQAHIHIIKVNKSQRMIWAGYVASMRQMTRLVFSIRDSLDERGRRSCLWMIAYGLAKNLLRREGGWLGGCVSR
jgi:hypothetical protein